jgi:hypothetical protein
MQDVPFVVGEVGRIRFANACDHDSTLAGKYSRSILFLSISGNTNFQTASESPGEGKA